MFNRKECALEGKEIPQEWCDQTQELFLANYQDFLDRENKYFDVFGKIYSQEIVLVISLLHKVEMQLAPTSVFISADINKDEKKPDKVLDDMVDLSGLIFDDIVATKDWNDYHDRWLETKYKKRNYHYKITRENVRLSLEAEELLKDQDQ